MTHHRRMPNTAAASYTGSKLLAYRRSDDMVVIEIDGLPYIAAEWLERKIYRDEVRAKRWRQDARRMGRRTDRASTALRSAYLWHALQSTYRVDKWRRNLKITLDAIEARQVAARIEFGVLVKTRRIELGMNQRELGVLAGIDNKTIHNVEVASFPPSTRTIESILSVAGLNLSWADLNPFLKESTPTEKRNRRRKAVRKSRRKSRRTSRSKMN